MRYELSDYEWTAIKPMLPNKQRGVRRVNDRLVLNGIFSVLRSGAPWPSRACPIPQPEIAAIYRWTDISNTAFALSAMLRPHHAP
jgi:transposase